MSFGNMAKRVLESFVGAAWARTGCAALLLAGMLLPSCLQCHAQEYPYFVAYSQEMEEPGNLDIECFNAVGSPPGGNSFIGSDVEFEYGLKGWWTTVRNTNLFADDVAVDPADHYLGSKQCQGERNYH